MSFCKRCQTHIDKHQKIFKTSTGKEGLRLSKNSTQDMPICAFDDKGYFKKDNWACETMFALRKLTEHNGYHGWNDDESIDVIGVREGEFLVLTYYKGRGRTGNAIILCDDEERGLTLKEVETILEDLEES